MLRKISATVLLVAASLSTNTYSMENHNPIQIQGITVEYQLAPNQPQVFTNYMFWAVEANCKILTSDESNSLRVVALAKKGKVNDVPMSSGQTLYVTVHQNENLKVAADSGAKVEITNLGEHTVVATCTA